MALRTGASSLQLVPICSGLLSRNSNIVVGFVGLSDLQFCWKEMHLNIEANIKGCWGSLGKTEGSEGPKFGLDISFGAKIMKVNDFRCLSNGDHRPPMRIP